VSGPVEQLSEVDKEKHRGKHVAVARENDIYIVAGASHESPVAALREAAAAGHPEAIMGYIPE